MCWLGWDRIGVRIVEDGRAEPPVGVVPDRPEVAQAGPVGSPQRTAVAWSMFLAELARLNQARGPW